MSGHIHVSAIKLLKRVAVAWSPSSQTFSRGVVTGVLAALLVAPQDLRSQTDLNDPLTFRRAYQLVVERSPQTQLLEAQLEVADGQVEQAMLKPNPVLGAELENALGTGELEGVESAELTIGISQLIERRAKRKARAALAESRKALLRWNYEQTLVDLRFATLQAFSNAVVAQQNVELQSELLELARSSEAEVARRAEAATASAIELSQARLATRRQRFQLSQAQRQLVEAKTALASLWNEPSEIGFRMAGDLQLEGELPSLDQLAALVDTAPALARFEAEKQVQQAAVAVEQAEAKADYELFGGVKYLREGGDEAAFVLGVDIPWKLHDRNQGSIRAAQAGLRVVSAQRQVVRRELLASLAISYRGLATALEEWRSLQDGLLPAAETALEETQQGYEQGITSLLSVLEARRSLFEIRSEMLDATKRYLNAKAALQRLTDPVVQP